MPESAANDQQRVKITDLSKVEEVVRLYASSKCIAYGLQPEMFEIHLVPKLRHDHSWEMQAGNPIVIEMLWPFCQPFINSELESIFRTIVRHRAYRTMEIVPVSFYKDQHKLYRSKFGELGDIMPDLVSRQRLRQQTTTTYTLRDVKTGESVTVTHIGREERFEGLPSGLWIALSRKIREKEPEFTDDPIGSDTPELDHAVHVFKEPEVRDGE